MVKSKAYAPIVLFTYNRPIHTEKTVNALKMNDEVSESDLIIFSDGAKSEDDERNVNLVRSYVKTIIGFRSVSIIERNTNFGLGNNIIDGVTTVVNKYGSVIVLEDDLITSPYFLKYMNDGLSRYALNKEVISISSYIYPIKKKLTETFFIKGADCLGWGTWKDKWVLFEPDGKKLLDLILSKDLAVEFDFNNAYPYTQMLKDQIAGKNTSWAVRWYASAFLQNRLTLYPGKSVVYHNGNDGSGTNFGVSTFLDVKLSDKPIEVNNIKIDENKYARKRIEYYFKYCNANKIKVLYRILKKLL